VKYTLAVLLLVIGCGVPDSGVSPIKPPTNDAASVIPSATKAYNAGLAESYERLAVGVESGELKTVRDAAERAVKEDQRLRGEYKSALGSMMESRLGSEELPADSPSFFREMSTAFGRLAK